MPVGYWESETRQGIDPIQILGLCTLQLWLRGDGSHWDSLGTNVCHISYPTRGKRKPGVLIQTPVRYWQRAAHSKGQFPAVSGCLQLSREGAESLKSIRSTHGSSVKLDRCVSKQWGCAHKDTRSTTLTTYALHVVEKGLPCSFLLWLNIFRV